MEQRVDALRVVQDPKYAAALSDDQWRALSDDPEWNLMLWEYSEMVTPVMEQYAAKLGIPAPSAAPPPPPPQDAPEQFQVIGRPIPRLHGLGVVTSLGQYVQNMRMNGMLFTRTLRSP